MKNSFNVNELKTIKLRLFLHITKHTQKKNILDV